MVFTLQTEKEYSLLNTKLTTKHSCIFDMSHCMVNNVQSVYSTFTALRYPNRNFHGTNF